MRWCVSLLSMITILSISLNSQFSAVLRGNCRCSLFVFKIGAHLERKWKRKMSKYMRRHTNTQTRERVSEMCARFTVDDRLKNVLMQLMCARSLRLPLYKLRRRYVWCVYRESRLLSLRRDARAHLFLSCGRLARFLLCRIHSLLSPFVVRPRCRRFVYVYFFYYDFVICLTRSQRLSLFCAVKRINWPSRAALSKSANNNSLVHTTTDETDTTENCIRNHNMMSDALAPGQTSRLFVPRTHTQKHKHKESKTFYVSDVIELHAYTRSRSEHTSIHSLNSAAMSFRDAKMKYK